MGLLKITSYVIQLQSSTNILWFQRCYVFYNSYKDVGPFKFFVFFLEIWSAKFCKKFIQKPFNCSVSSLFMILLKMLSINKVCKTAMVKKTSLEWHKARISNNTQISYSIKFSSTKQPQAQGITCTKYPFCNNPSALSTTYTIQSQRNLLKFYTPTESQIFLLFQRKPLSPQLPKLK